MTRLPKARRRFSISRVVVDDVEVEPCLRAQRCGDEGAGQLVSSAVMTESRAFAAEMT